jgi:hypothetical protein
MHFKKQLLVTAGALSIIALSVAASLPKQQREEPKLVNIKVFPKNVPYRVLDHQMDVWAASLGVRCNFCHARNEATGKMDFPSDAKPEKTTARHMYLMMNKINKKFFQAQKDSLGMMMTTGVNCNTCHRGTAHPEVKVPEEHHGPGGPPPGGPGSPPPGAPPSGK